MINQKITIRQPVAVPPGIALGRTLQVTTDTVLLPAHHRKRLFVDAALPVKLTLHGTLPPGFEFEVVQVGLGPAWLKLVNGAELRCFAVEGGNATNGAHSSIQVFRNPEGGAFYVRGDVGTVIEES